MCINIRKHELYKYMQTVYVSIMNGNTNLPSTEENSTSLPSQPSAPNELIDTQAGRRYWENAEASTDGMLGGIPTHQAYSHISRTDILGSRSFLAKLNIGVHNGRSTVKSAVDGGAGYVGLISYNAYC